MKTSIAKEKTQPQKLIAIKEAQAIKADQKVEKNLPAKKDDKKKMESADSKKETTKSSSKKPNSLDIPADVPDTEEGRKWVDYWKKHGADPAAVYSISGVFEANTPLEHKVLGWGYIISVLNDRLEVLFKDGIKHLISNYKSQ